MIKETILAARLCKFCQLPLEHRFIDILIPQRPHLVDFNTGVDQSSKYLLPTFVCAHCFLVQADDSYLETAEPIFISSFGSSRLTDMKIYTEKIFKHFYTSDHHLEVELLKRTVNSSKQADVFFGTSGLHSLLDMYGQADSIHCHDELVYANDINDFIKALKLFIKPSGVVTMKFLHLLPIFEGHSLAECHSDRFPFLSFTTVDKMLKKHGLVIFDVDYPVDTREITICIKHTDNLEKHITQAVTALRGRERDFGMSSLRCYTVMREKLLKLETVTSEVLSTTEGFH